MNQSVSEMKRKLMARYCQGAEQYGHSPNGFAITSGSLCNWERYHRPTGWSSIRKLKKYDNIALIIAIIAWHNNAATSPSFATRCRIFMIFHFSN